MTAAAQIQTGFFRGLVSDDGIQRAIAGVVVAGVVAVTKRLIFRA